jgi:hypothetical protein
LCPVFGQPLIGSGCERKRKTGGYQLNRNIGANTLMMYLPSLLRCPENQLEKLLDGMQVYYLQSLEMIKETQLGRKRKMMRLGGIPQNDRHHPEMNWAASRCKRGF